MKKRRRKSASPAQLRARANFARMARAGKFRRGKRRTVRARRHRGSVGAQFGSLPILVKQGGKIVAAFQGTPQGVKRAKQYARILARHSGQACGVYRR